MRKRSKKAPKELTAGIRVDVKPDTAFYYVNYMTVSHTPYDFNINVTRIPSSLTPEQIEVARKGQPVPVEATLQLVVPPPVVKGLIRALTDQVQKYEKKFGAKKNEQ